MKQTTPARYHSLQVTLHWLTVVLIFAAFILGKFMSRLPNDDVSKLTPLAIHMSLGITTLVVIVVRFITRMKLPRPAYASTGNAFLDGLGNFVHHALYLVVFLMAVSGMSLALQTGLPSIVFFGSGAPLPADFFDFAARALHEFIAPALLILVILHVGGALYHQFLLKDNLLARMWYAKK
jgi:cytochrome b561